MYKYAICAICYMYFYIKAKQIFLIGVEIYEKLTERLGRVIDSFQQKDKKHFYAAFYDG